MKNSLSQKLLATILSAALLLNSSAVVFATDEGISGADGTPIVTASETAATTEETPSADETTTNETTLPAEDATTESNEQGDLSDPEGSDSVLPGEDADESDCTCNPAIGTSGVEGHGEDCPLYVAPEQGDCTCPPVDSGEVTHSEGCPLYETPNVPEQSEAVKAVLALLDALPTMDELVEVDTEVPKFAEYLAQLRLDTAAARAAYDALTEEEKAALDADALAKLTALEEVLARMPMLMTANTVTTWAELTAAINAAPTTGTETTITINGTIDTSTITNVITLSAGKNIVINGGKIEGIGKLLFQLTADSKLTLQNFHVDGKKTEDDVTDSYIISNAGTLIISDGCIFENINLPTTSVREGIIENLSSGECMVTGGIFRNNTSISNAEPGYSCVAIYSLGTVTITGGTFSNNRHTGTGFGAALYNASSAKCYITGGTFDSSNVAESNKAGIFHSSQNQDATGEMHLSGDPAINCPLFLDAGNADKFIFLDGALTGNVTLKPAKYEEGYVLVKAADGHTLTNDDYLNIKLLQPASGTWYTKLSADGQSIVATEAAGERLATVYLAPVDGDDINDGKTAATAIKTFNKAKQLLANGGKIILVPPVTISTDELWELPDGVFGGATVTDDGKVTITVGNGGSLNLGDVTIDGIDRIEVGSGGSVTLGDTTVIKPETGGKTDIVVGGGGTLEIGKDTNLSGIDKIYTTGGGTVNDNGNTAAGGKTDSTATPPSVTEPECACVLSAPTFAGGTIEIPHDAASATQTLTASGSTLTGDCTKEGHSGATVTYSYAVQTDASSIATVSGSTLTVTAAGDVTITATATANSKTATKDATFTVTKASAPAGTPLDSNVTKLESGTTYTIADAAQLDKLSALVNDDITDDTDYTVKLLNNVTASDTFVPIGTNTSGYRFAGTFDGGGNVVTLNLTNTEKNYQGLFGYVDESGTVQNVGVAGTVSGKDYVGGVVGYNFDGTVQNCYNTATVSGNDKIGGVVGGNPYHTVQNSYNTGAVSGTNIVGGVVGDNGTGTVKNCYNTGAVSGNNKIGGVVGHGNYSNNKVENCYNTGAVSGSEYVGGVSGYNNNGTVKNCYNTGTVSGKGAVGGVVGDNPYNSTVESCVSLGASVTRNGFYDSFGRVVGSNRGTLTGNKVRSDMLVLGATVTSADATSINGADVTVGDSTLQSDVFANWDAGVWTIPTGGKLVLDAALPTLVGFTAAQSPTLPEGEVVPPKITITVNGTATEYGGASLSDAVTKALNGAAASTISTLEITAGEVTTADWKALNSTLVYLKTFEIADDAAVTDVANIPDGAGMSPVFPKTHLISVTIPQVVTVGNYAFNNCDALTTVSLPKATSIGTNAFYGCPKLTGVNLPKATTIGESAFQSCTALTSVELPAATTISTNAFQNCTALTSVSLPAATGIGKEAFKDCKSLATVSLPKAETIGLGAFDSCILLARVDLSAATGISNYAFENCTALTSVNLPAATTISDYAFQSCTALTSVNLPAATTISDYAFQSCTALTSVSLPAATSIGTEAFSGCTKLAMLKLPATPPQVTYGDAFSNCPTPRTLTLVDANGTALTDTALTTAIADYKAANDGNTGDNLWYGWQVREAAAGHTCNGITFDKSVPTSGDTFLAGNYYLDGDVEASVNLVVANGTTVNLCLNGHTLTASNPNEGGGNYSSITVQPNGTLNIYDCSAGNTGKITGGSARKGGCIYNEGTLNLHGGTITGNTAASFGGGVFSEGKVTLYGNASITGNTKNGTSSNLYHDVYRTIEVGSKLTSTIGISPFSLPDANSSTTIAKAAAGYTLTEDDASCFVSDVPGYTIKLDGTNVVMEKIVPQASWAATGGATGQGTLKEAIEAVKATGGTVTLLTDVRDNSNVLYVDIEGFAKPVTLILNGKTLYGCMGFMNNTGLFTIDGTAANSKIQGVGGMAIMSDSHLNLNLKGGTYIGAFDESGETSEVAPAIMVQVAANNPAELAKLKTLLADGYKFESEDGFKLESGEATFALTGNTVNVVPDADSTGTPLESNVTKLESGKTYTIANAAQLDKLSALVKNGGQSGTGATINLLNNITASVGFVPIGTFSNDFEGTFDGGSHVVTLNLTNASTDNQGLFGYVGERGTVKNVGVAGKVSGKNNVGGVVGENKGTVQSCYNTGTVSGTGISVGGVVGYNDRTTGTVQSCYNTGTVNSTGSSVGGVVGENFNRGTVTNCYNTGEVSGTSTNVGGVVGKNRRSTVQNCYNTGTVTGTGTGTVNGNGSYVGGVVGDNEGTVQSCYNTGAVSGKQNVGGVVGYNDSIAGTVQNCYNIGTVSGTGNSVGGVVGSNNGTVKSCVSLGASVTGTGHYFGRVVGSNYGTTLADNKARADMLVNGATVTGTATDQNGADVTVGGSTTQAGVFDSTAFSGTNGWNTISGNLTAGATLPTLTGFTAAQNPTLPSAVAVASAITIKINGNATTYGGESLKAAVAASGVTANTITTLTVTAGTVTETDWKALKTTLPALKTLEIDKAVETVAHIPAGQLSSPIFPQSLISVTIPQAITVGEYAFSNLRTRLTTVNLSGATKIDYRAFYECDNLATVTLNSVTEIAGEAFYGCETLKTIILPKADKIGFSAFYDCTALSSVALPVVTSIGNDAFKKCTALATMKLPAKPPIVASDPFSYCAADRSIAFVNANGNQLAGAALTNAQAAYDDITTDRNKKDDGLWYGWKVRGAVVTVSAPGGTLDSLTQDNVDSVFGEGNATLDGGKITINNNITVENTIIVKPSPIIIDLGGNTITGGAGANPVIKIDGGGTGTITGGTITGNTGADGNGGAGVEVGSGNTVVVGGGTGINGGNGTTGNGGDAITGGGNVVIGGGSVTGGNGGSNGSGGSGVDVGGNTTVENGSTVSGGSGTTGGSGITGGGNVTVDGTVTGGSGSSGNGGAGVDTSGGTGSITIGGGGSATGGNGTSGGNGVTGGGNVTVDGSVSGGAGSSGSGGAGVDTSGGSGNIIIKPDGSASGGNSTGGNGNGGNGTTSGGNTTVNGDATGGSGSGSGSGGNGAESSGSGSVTVGNGGSATGGAGGNTGSGTGGSGGNGTTTGSGSTDIGAGGSASGGNGGAGSTGGNGGNGSTSTGGGNITNGGSTTGGNGGSGATGGNGGNGTTTDGSTTVNGGGSSTGGTGGSGSTTGGNGGNGTNSGSTTVNGDAMGGSGGSGTSGSNGNGGNGGAGANQGSGTVGGNGTATGGNGGSGAGTGTGGNGGSGVGGGATAGDQLTIKDGINAKVEVVGDSGTKVKLPDPAKTVDAVLTDAEKSDPDITNVKVTLKVDDKTAAKPDQAAVEAQKPAGSSIGAFFDITLLKTITGGTNAVTDKLVTNTSGLVKITIEIPSGMRDGEENSYVVIRVHNGTAERLNTTQSGNELTFETDKFSTYAIAYTKNATPPSPPSDNTGGGGSSSDNSEYDFWMSVKEKIQKADSGDVVKVNAKGYDKMPWSVMDILRKNDGVSLVITWNGKTITIPAGKTQKNEPGRIYWPLSKLAELYEGLTQDSVLVSTNPETGGPGKYIPVTGGGELITLEAPTPVMENAIPGGAENIQAITPTHPKAITPPDAGFEQDAFAGTPDNPQQATSNNTFAVIALMLAAVAVGSGVWFWKKKQGAQ